MELHFSLRVGPLEAEITADSEEDYERELIQLMDFLQSQQNQLSEISLPEVELSETNTPTTKQSSVDKSGDKETGQVDSREETDSEVTPSVTSGPLSSLVRKVDLSQKEVREIVDVDPELEEPPLLLVESDNLGDSTKDQQLIGTLLLLSVWSECYDESPVELSKVKDGLEHAGISTANFYRMYDHDGAQRYLRRSGERRGKKIRLTRVGDREAYERLEEICS